MSKSASEVLIELHLQRLLLIVLIAFLCLAVETLLAIEQITGLVPYIAQMVNVKAQFLIISSHNQMASFFHRITDLGIAHTGFFHEFLERSLMFVAHLNYNTRIFGKECFYYIAVFAYIMQIDV